MGCGASATAASDQKGKQPDGDVHTTKTPIPSIKTSMRGDYSQFQLAKYHREKLQKERQIKLSMAADEFSEKVLEERERLSLGNRSRATSRNTSRTTSPSNNRRNAQPKEESNVPMTPVIEDRNRSESYRSDSSMLKSPVGATTHVETQEHKEKAKSKHKKKSNKAEKKSKGKTKKKSKKSKSKNRISFESDDNDSGLEDSGNQIDNSDEINSVDGEDKVIEQAMHDTNDLENDDTKTDKVIGEDDYKTESDVENLPVSVGNNGYSSNTNKIDNTKDRDFVVNEKDSVSKTVVDSVNQPDSIPEAEITSVISVRKENDNHSELIDDEMKV